MEPIIEIRNVSKQYMLGEAGNVYGSFREVLTRAARKPLDMLRHHPATNGNGNGNGHKKPTDFWALKNVSYDVHRGDTVAVIGSNGAGKSTLLKVLSRITDPTEGYVKIRGNMASLLEVGTGFHPELSGRENIYLNGAILGMRKTEIDAKFDEIVAFAGIDKFLDTPVKRYSSGMYVRLAFSIAAHLDPEVLIVDEVLAVGDVAFQKKCLGKMAEACSKDRTVLFVSHNFAAIEALCNKGLVLQSGVAVFSGTAQEAIKYYMENTLAEGAGFNSNVVDLTTAPGRPEKYRPQLKRLELYDGEGKPLRGEVPVGSTLKAVICVNLETPCTSFDVELAFDTTSGQRICCAHSAYEPNRVHEQRSGEQTFTCEIPSVPLIPGEYKLHVGLDVMNMEADCVVDATRITVTRADFFGTGVIPARGVFLMPNRWRLL